MKKCLQIIILGLFTSLLISCGVTERSVQRTEPPSESSDKSTAESLPRAISVSKYKEVQETLEQAYRDWKGTPYRFGGISSSGIDCSAFMQVLFDDYFGIQLPRNTKRQLYFGEAVKRQSLRTGDLVFFKTGRKTLHVGVIIWEDEFLHASTSQGVTTSKLDDYYWKSRYLAARRVMELQ